MAAEKPFTLNGTSFILEDVSTEVQVQYQSMRLNRALNVWNVEASLRNSGTRALQGPLVISVESFTGTTGLLQPDGLDAETPAKAFLDMSGTISNGVLGPGAKSANRTLSLGKASGSPKLVTKVYATRQISGTGLALVRTLNEAGQPLTEVTVDEVGPTGTNRLSTDASFGLATVGQGIGSHAWKFSKAGYLPAWRQEVLGAEPVKLLPSPRLTKRSGSVALTPIGGLAASAGGAIQVNYQPGAIVQDTGVTVTALNGQTLPIPLPLGWSPLQAFWIEHSIEPTGSFGVAIRPFGAIAPNETAALARLNEATLQWDVLQLLPGNGTNPVSGTVTSSGAYVLVLGDSGPGAPAPAEVGRPLQSSTLGLPNPSTLTATGIVNPATSPASRVPELVTGQANLTIAAASGALPSGLLLRTEISDRYQLQDGTTRHPPQFEGDIFAYQRPGDAGNVTLHATFPLRPILLFGSEELQEGTVAANVLTPTPFVGALIDSGGGIITADGVQIIAGAGDLTGQQAVQLRRLNPTNFADLAGTNLTIVDAFELSVTGLATNRHVQLQLAAATNGLFVLARVLYDQGLYGLEPVERLGSDSAGKLSSREPGIGDRLPGVTGAGQYVLARVSGPQGLIIGTAKNSAGQAADGLPVQVQGQPWLTFTKGGSYRLLASAGPVQVVTTDLNTTDTGTTSIRITNPDSTFLANVNAVASGPQVIAINPTNNAIRVSRVTSITISFSKPVNPATLLGNGIQLLGTNGQPVQASLSLNLKNTIATLLPTEQLTPSASFAVRLSTDVADVSGRKLLGTNTFRFTTEDDFLNRTAVQVISYEPDTNGFAGMTGSVGIAEPEAPVILVNETTGETATVLSRPDGSFTNSIRADAGDLLSAIVVNRNGTRNTIPVSRQIFRDGSVGFFNGGGAIETTGAGGSATLTIQAGAIEEKTRLKVEMVDAARVGQLTENTPPREGKLLGRALHVAGSGSAIKGAANVSFSVAQAELEQLGLPQGGNPTNATYALVAITKVDGKPAYMVLNSMEYEDGKLVTHSPPFPGAEFLLEPQTEALGAAVEGVQIVSESIGAFFGPFNFLMTPLILAFQTQPVKFTGAVVEFSSNAGQLVATPLPGTVVTLRAFKENQEISPPRGGRLDPGQLYAVAQKRGVYALVQPRPFLSPFDPEPRFDYVLTATHPRLFGQVVFKSANPPVINLSVTDLIFRAPARSTFASLPPGVLVSHAPAFPAIGTNAEVTVTMTHVTGTPALEALEIEDVQPLPPETAVSLTDVHVGTRTTEDVTAQIRREHFTIRSDRAAEVTLRLKAVITGVEPTVIHYTIPFGGTPPSEGNPEPADKNDKVGPRVLVSEPSPGSTAIEPGRAIRLVFNEPVDRNTITANSLSLEPLAGEPKLTLSPDQREVLIAFPEMQFGTAYELHFGQNVTDLPPAANKFDQDGSSTAPDLFKLKFETAPKILASFPGVVSGAGTVLRGSFAYVLDRLSGRGDAKLRVFDISDPANPAPAAEHLIAGTPRDLVLIPSYSFRRRPGAPIETKDLLAVSFGNIGTDFDGVNFLGGGQFIRIFDISDPTRPINLVTRQVTLSFVTVVPRMRWSPPILAYLENSADFQAIGLINLQTMILAQYMSQEEFNNSVGSSGVDVNGDGDFVDANEELPMPSPESPDFAGKVFSFSLNDTTQRIRDFNYNFAGGYVGAALSDGKLKGITGQPTSQAVGPCYRTLFAGNLTLPREAASFEFPSRDPKRFFNLFGLPLQLPGASPRTFDLAFVSVNGVTAGATVEVLDITDPTGPRLLTTLPLKESDGLVQSIQRRADGMLLVGTTENVLVIDPNRLLDPVPSNGIHPAVVSRFPSIGSGAFSFGTEEYGVISESLGTKNQLLQTPPQIEFVAFPSIDPFDPEALVGQDEALAEQFKNRIVVKSLLPCRVRGIAGTVNSTLSPPSPRVHYYVLIRAPGGNTDENETIDILLESLNENGQPLRNKGAGFPPVRAASEMVLEGIRQRVRATCDAPIRPLKAFRLSNDKRSVFYNVYLSRPFALSYESITKDELLDLQEENNLKREILWSGHFLRATLDKTMSDRNAMGRFAASVDTARLAVRPGVMAIAESLAADYVMGPNPPPVTGASVAPGTFGTVSAHNGEIRIDTVDIALPSRRMPIIFERHAGAQDLYDGPFGRGWDFNYNQRLVELKGALLDPESNVPLVLRGGVGDEIGREKDLLFYPGDGRTLLYTFAGSDTNPPSIIAQDPMVGGSELNWLNTAKAYYRPPTGVFDFFVRFADGRFARLNPEGTQYWYNPSGRLERIYDRYEKNSHELTYNEKGELVLISDKSVSVPRYLQIGYWRPADEVQDQDLDRIAQSEESYKIGKIGRLKDYTGRDLLFDYSECGELEVREGVDVSFAGIGGDAHRARTEYLPPQNPTEQANGIRGLVTGSIASAALFAAQGFSGDPKTPVVSLGNGAAGSVHVNLSHQNTAAAVAAGGASTTVGAADNSNAQFAFDKEGLPQEIKYSGGGAANASVKYVYTNGLLGQVIYPEGNSITYVYDFGNGVLRSRGNLIRMKRDGGARSADPVPEATFAYDNKYNFSSGTHHDFNGNQIIYEPDAAGKDIGRIRYEAGPGITPTSGTEEMHRNDYGQIEVYKTIEGFETHFGYDSAKGFMISETRVDAGTTGYAYTPHASHDGDLGLPTQITPPSGALINLTYDEREELISKSRGDQQEDRSYDINGNLIRRSTALSPSQTLVETRSYLQNGFLESVTLHDVETGGGTSDLTFEFVRDEVFRVKEIRHPLPIGNGQRAITRFEDFDHLGRHHRLIEGEYSEDYTYDLNGNILTVTRSGTTDRYEYDGFDRLRFVRKEGQSGTEVVERGYYGNDDLKFISVSDGQQQVVTRTDFGIDAVGRVTVERAASDDNGSVPRSYDFSGLDLTVREQTGEQTTVNWDKAARLKHSADSVRNLEWAYDNSENITQITSTEAGIGYNTFFENYNNLEQYRQLRDNVGILVQQLTPRFDGILTSSTDARGGTTEYNPTKLGESSTRLKPNGMEFHYQYDEHRNLSSVTDKQSRGHSFSYDDTLRLSEQGFRAGNPAVATAFDPRHRRPLTISTPGGSQSLGYDAQGRLTSRTVNFTSGNRSETFVRDPLDRILGATYPPASSAAFKYDKLGPMRKATFIDRGVGYELRSTIRSDGARQTLSYPDPETVTVTEERDTAGRLETVSVSGQDPVVIDTDYAGANIVGTQLFGPNIVRCENLFDGRKRLLARRYTANGGATLLGEVRYAYDATDNIVGRQFVHRAGRADFFQYDAGQRLLRADIGVRPAIALTGLRPGYSGFRTPGEVSGAWSPGFFARVFGYDAGNGLDVFTGITEVNPDSLAPPTFGKLYGAPDGFLQIGVIDGLARPTDELGNTIRSRLFVRPNSASDPVETKASLVYDGLRQLTRIDRDDGTSILYDYQHDGLCFHRTVIGPGAGGTRESGFVYDGGLLVAEYDRSSGNNRLQARYYYADTDVPVAADIRDAVGTLRRYYLMSDALGSVMGLVDTNGAVVERYFYDTWGQPEIQTPDHVPPHIRRVLTAPDGNGLIVEFTERVLPPLTSGLANNLRANFQDLAGAFQLETSSQNLAPTVVYEESLNGFTFGTALRLLPGVAISGSITLTLSASRVNDEWGNLNAVQATSFNFNATPGTVLFVDERGPTDSPTLARSALGNPFLFQGQYFDYDAGLVYMRARFYDPGSGLFLQQDPNGYEDSVNLYAAFRNNPVTVRDPTGRAAVSGLMKLETELEKRTLAAIARGESKISAREEMEVQRALEEDSWSRAQAAGKPPKSYSSGVVHSEIRPPQPRAASVPKAATPHAPPREPQVANKIASNGETGVFKSSVDSAAPTTSAAKAESPFAAVDAVPKDPKVKAAISRTFELDPTDPVRFRAQIKQLEEHKIFFSNNDVVTARTGKSFEPNNRGRSNFETRETFIDEGLIGEALSGGAQGAQALTTIRSEIFHEVIGREVLHHAPGLGKTPISIAESQVMHNFAGSHPAIIKQLIGGGHAGLSGMNEDIMKLIAKRGR
jgi:RHS repeat-associated protein